MTTEDIKDLILKMLEEKKASHINCIELSGEVNIAKYMVFASGRSIKNISAIAEFIAYELKHKLNYRVNVEGLKGSEWVVIDAGEVIVHLFHPESRKTLNLEELWNKN